MRWLDFPTSHKLFRNEELSVHSIGPPGRRMYTDIIHSV